MRALQLHYPVAVDPTIDSCVIFIQVYSSLYLSVFVLDLYEVLLQAHDLHLPQGGVDSISRRKRVYIHRHY